MTETIQETRPPKRGRPPSLIPKDERLRAAQQKRRKKIKDAGQKEVLIKVSTNLVSHLRSLKKSHNQYNDYGQIIEAVFKKELEPGEY